jgi:hypothetical protein
LVLLLTSFSEGMGLCPGDRIVKKPREPEPDIAARRPHCVRLPGFLIEEEIGLGDLIKKTTYAMGINPCGRCERRAAALNRWMTFSR